jgi:hypothetical protein
MRPNTRPHLHNLCDVNFNLANFNYGNFNYGNRNDNDDNHGSSSEKTPAPI